MRYILLLVASLVSLALPALAQQGGLPALQTQVNALQAQNASLQQQIAGLQGSVVSLQTQINNLPLPPADDGTAQALVGSWTGSVSSVEFDRSSKPTAPGSPPSSAPFFAIFGGVPAALAPNFTVPLLGPCSGGGTGLCQTGNMVVGINPEFWVARGGTDSISAVFSRDGMKLSGSVLRDGVEIATLTGVVLGNNFFLLRVRAPATGPCAGSGFSIFQGIGTLSADRTRLSFTGSAIDQDCQHTVFRVALTK